MNQFRQLSFGTSTDSWGGRQTEGQFSINPVNKAIWDLLVDFNLWTGIGIISPSLSSSALLISVLPFLKCCNFIIITRWTIKHNVTHHCQEPSGLLHLLTNSTSRNLPPSCNKHGPSYTQNKLWPYMYVCSLEARERINQSAQELTCWYHGTTKRFQNGENFENCVRLMSRWGWSRFSGTKHDWRTAPKIKLICFFEEITGTRVITPKNCPWFECQWRCFLYLGN
jgi:hypothetical protein